jgi:hypothetical protein
MRGRRWVFIVPAAIAGLVLFVGIGGWVVMQLWNWLTPTLFGWPAITFWQALGLLALTRILVGGHGLRGSGRGGRCRPRWDRMTPEERERFRRRMRERWGAEPAAEGQGPS